MAASGLPEGVGGAGEHFGSIRIDRVKSGLQTCGFMSYWLRFRI